MPALPPPPPPPEPPSTELSPEEKEKIKKEQDAIMRRRKGRKETILTGPLGIQETEEEALELANSTQYGLASTVHTNDLSRAHRVAENLHAGIVWVNSWLVRDLRTPFGGVKNSGVGREGGFEALHFFTEPKNVFIKS